MKKNIHFFDQGEANTKPQVLERIGKSGLQGACGPKLNPKSDPSKWLSNDHAPRAKLANEKPQGKTMPYKQIMKEMLEGKLPL